MFNSYSDSFTVQNQLSITYGAVLTWSGQHRPKETEAIAEKFIIREESVSTETLKSVNSQELNYLVESATSMQASGNRVRSGGWHTKGARANDRPPVVPCSRRGKYPL